MQCRRILPGLFVVLVSLSGCGADLWYFETNHLSGGGTTLLIVKWSDSPVDDAESVRVVLDRVDLVGLDHDDEILTDQRRTFELLDLRNGEVAQLARRDVPSGAWRGLRFTLAPDAQGLHTIRVGGTTHELAFPSPGGHVIDVPYALDLEEGATVEIHVDFNVRMSVLDAGEDWFLTPRLNAMDPRLAGWLLGRIETEPSTPLGGVTVSAQQGGTEVLSTRSSSDGTWRLGPLTPGRYALVATAPQYAPAYEAEATVFSGIEAGGFLLTLGGAPHGGLTGTAPAGTAGLVVRVRTAQGLLSLAGVDPVDGSFSLPSLPPGSYTVELWDAVGPIDALPTVLVEAHQTTTIVF